VPGPKARRRYGTGSGGSHLILGHSRAHALLEDRLAAWMAPFIPEARSLFFCTGYMANLAVLSALGGADAVIFSEALNHASLIDGARLAKARVQRYPHCDLAALDAQLCACDAPVKLIVSDAVFSMDGHLAPVAGLLALAERHDAWLVLDDAHGFGVLGATGRGVPKPRACVQSGWCWSARWARRRGCRALSWRRTARWSTTWCSARGRTSSPRPRRRPSRTRCWRAWR
jgi:7-keto-8-aminopelargonate synthetase-like enzyme